MNHTPSNYTTLRGEAKKLNRPLAILQDLQGPKIRVGTLERPIRFNRGNWSTCTLKEEKNQAARVFRLISRNCSIPHRRGIKS